MIVIEQVDGVVQAFSWVSQILVDKDLHVELLVSPVDLKERLEISDELPQFTKGVLKDGPDNFRMTSVDWIRLNPLFWIKFGRVRLFPLVTDDIIPIFQSISIWTQIRMLVPPLKLFNLIKS